MAKQRPRARDSPGVAALLATIRKGDWQAIGVLADYLEENGLPHARRLRSFWDKYQRMERYWLKAENEPRRTNARWEEVALWRRWLWRRVRTMYGYTRTQWKQPDLKRFYTRPVVADPVTE